MVHGGFDDPSATLSFSTRFLKARGLIDAVAEVRDQPHRG